MDIAISYDRFSGASQEHGDSTRRQDDGATAWCRKRKIALDKTRRYIDRAKSAYRGENRDTGVLRQFLEEVQAGHITKGTYLLIENMDRISRQKPVIAVHLITSILLAGIRIVQLAPDEIELTVDSDLFTLFRGQLAQARGHDESKTKSFRLLETFAQKKKRARETGEIITQRVPAWVEVKSGKMYLRRERAKVIRQMFRWCIEGCGLGVIVRRLTEADVAPWGGAKHWSKMYVAKILRGKSVIGEHQPMLANMPDGETILNYYPRVVDDSTWIQAQAALDNRRQFPGRTGHKVASIFGGLLWDAGTQGRMYMATGTSGSRGKHTYRRILRSAASMENAAPRCTFLAEVFEREILLQLREINVSELLGTMEESESEAIGKERAAVEQRLRQLKGDLVGSDEDVPTLTQAVRELTIRHQQLTDKLNAAQQKEANPAAVAWAEMQTLAEAAVTEETRIRLRGLVRRTIESIWVLIVPNRSRRLVAVQIHFNGGRRRDYLIDYRSAKHPRPMHVETMTATWEADERGPGRDFDLRNREQSAMLEAFLARLMK